MKFDMVTHIDRSNSTGSYNFELLRPRWRTATFLEKQKMAIEAYLGNGFAGLARNLA